MTTLINADPKAVAVARHICRSHATGAVILFGSRARGNHRTDSDIDIMVVYDRLQHPDVPNTVGQSARAYAAELYGIPITVQFLWVPRTLFDHWSRTLNHPIVHALLEGIFIHGDRSEYPLTDHANEPHYARQLFREATDFARTAHHAAIVDHPLTDREVAHQCRLALLHAVRFAYSASCAEYPPKASLPEIARSARQDLAGFPQTFQSHLDSLERDLPNGTAQHTCDLMLADLNAVFQFAFRKYLENNPTGNFPK